MKSTHSFIILDAAPRLSTMFRTNPSVAALLEPAVYVVVRGNSYVATVVERRQCGALSRATVQTQRYPLGIRSSYASAIMVFLWDENGPTTYKVPDPRMQPDLWPWGVSEN
jgi:hypothetical protein